MQILAINAAGRQRGATTRLAAQALAGAASLGATTEMVMLKNHDIRFCTNCLTCYQDRESRIAPCALKDDVRAILEKIAAADGVLFASPVHCGFVSGLMMTFIERAVWPLCLPAGEMMGVGGVPLPRLTDKARVTAGIVSAGGIPPELRQYCDTGTPWLRETAAMLCNGPWVGDVYAGAIFPRPLDGQQWSRAYLLRELTAGQLEEAFALGQAMARAIQAGPEPFCLPA
ncbi:MAG: flavodoxin family protein [Thermodesulfobacteriota bacterium]